MQLLNDLDFFALDIQFLILYHNKICLGCFFCLFVFFGGGLFCKKKKKLTIKNKNFLSACFCLFSFTSMSVSFVVGF